MVVSSVGFPNKIWDKHWRRFRRNCINGFFYQRNWHNRVRCSQMSWNVCGCSKIAQISFFSNIVSFENHFPFVDFSLKRYSFVYFQFRKCSHSQRVILQFSSSKKRSAIVSGKREDVSSSRKCLSDSCIVLYRLKCWNTKCIEVGRWNYFAFLRRMCYGLRILVQANVLFWRMGNKRRISFVVLMKRRNATIFIKSEVEIRRESCKYKKSSNNYFINFAGKVKRFLLGSCYSDRINFSNAPFMYAFEQQWSYEKKKKLWKGCISHLE